MYIVSIFLNNMCVNSQNALITGTAQTVLVNVCATRKQRPSVTLRTARVHVRQDGWAKTAVRM